jgi:hypothetical protein
MVANVTFSNIYWNNSLRNFFWREQSMDTLEELMSRSTMANDDILELLDERTETEDIDEVEEDFYSLSVEELADNYGIELQDEDDEDEDDEE